MRCANPEGQGRDGRPTLSCVSRKKSWVWLAALLAFLTSATAMAGLEFSSVQAGYAGDSDGDWSNPGNVIGLADNNCSNMGAVDKANLVSGFGFNLPADAEVTGITAHIKAAEQGNQDIRLQLASDATVSPPVTIGSPQTHTVAGVGNGNCANTQVDSYGAALGDWGLASLSPAVVNASEFGIAFIKIMTSSVKVDSICLEIAYDTDTGPGVQASCFGEEPSVQNTINVVKVVEGEVPASDWSFTGTDPVGAFVLPAAGGNTSFSDLDDGSYTITETTQAGYQVAVECFIDDVVVSSGSNEVTVDVAEGESANCVFTNTVVGSFTVRKDFTDDNPDPVDVTLSCTSGDITTNPMQASEGSSAVFEVTGYDAGTTCTATESVPPGYEADISDCQDGDPINGGCVIINSPIPRATFRVTKDFTDDNPNGVEVQISCNTGLPLDQSKVITESEHVEFIVTEFDGGELDCDVSEVVPDGYSPTYTAGFDEAGDAIITDDADGCHFEEVVAGDFTCHIVNAPDPVTVEINKEWVFEGSSGPDGVDTEYWLTLWCDAEIIDGYQLFGADQESPQTIVGPGCGPILMEAAQGLQPIAEWCISFHDDSPETFLAQVIPEYPDSHCWVTEIIYDDAVEVENGCQDIVVSAGKGASCTIINTVFFEGIPTLSAQGLALLALLMLGIGAVSFRRFS